MYPPDACGIGGDPACAAVPRNATIALRFDRPLNPATVNRQAIRVYTGDPQLSPSVTFQVDYDPIERVVEYRVPPGSFGFQPQTLYEVELLVPTADADFGFRAFDGTPVAEGDVPLHTRFFTGNNYVDHPQASVPRCETIWRDVFVDLGGCSARACHTSGPHQVGESVQPDAPYGLRLDSAAALRETAVSRVARETDLGDFSGGAADLHGPRFGVRMPIMDGDGHSPGSSYLLYKLLLLPENTAPCGRADLPLCQLAPAPGESIHRDLPLARGDSLQLSSAERARLREWFVRGEPMPAAYPDDEGHLVRGAVTLEGLRALSSFIAAGADCNAVDDAADSPSLGAAGATQ